MDNKPDKIIWHHTADDSWEKQWAKINEYHKTKGFTLSSLGFYGGYHILIEKDGTIFRYRQDEEEGCHTIGENTRSLGIALAGNFSIKYPTQEQEDSLRRQLRDWITGWNIAKEDIMSHRKFANTECPGLNLSDNWARDLIKTNDSGATNEILMDILHYIKSKLI
jgi:hypothetical protein